MSCSEEYTPQLRARGYRMTPQRLAILHVLHHSGKHMTPTQIFERASRQLEGLTETTVYRTLEFLSENSLVRSSQVRNGHLVYEIAGHEHHHLICRYCGKEEEVEHTLLKTVYQRLEETSGYKLTNSHVTFFGICPACQS